MILRVLHVQPFGDVRLDLAFNNGVRKIVNVKKLPFGPSFAPLREPGYFAEVPLDHDCGTVVWPNGVDIAPEALLELDAVVFQRLETATHL